MSKVNLINLILLIIVLIANFLPLYFDRKPLIAPPPGASGRIYFIDNEEDYYENISVDKYVELDGINLYMSHVIYERYEKFDRYIVSVRTNDKAFQECARDCLDLRSPQVEIIRNDCYVEDRGYDERLPKNYVDCSFYTNDKSKIGPKLEIVLTSPHDSNKKFVYDKVW